MKKYVKIGIIGEYDAKKASHPATMEAINHASSFLSVKATVTWLPTTSILKTDAKESLKYYDAIWASSGSPYQNMEGALKAIQAARETGRSFIGT